MDKKKNIPEIRFKGFTEGWEHVKLGEIAKLGSSKRVHREDYVETGIPFFRGTEISKLGNSSVIEDLLYISEEFYEKLKNSYGIPKIGDILITAVGTLGNPFLITSDKKFYFKDGNLIWVSNININSKYLITFLENGIGKKRVLESAAGSSQKALTMDKLQNVIIDFPKEDEQKQIGSFFQNLDNLITLHQKKYDKLVVLKKAMLDKMFPKKGALVPEIRFKGFTEVWVEKKLIEFGASTSGTSIESEFCSNGKYKVISIGSYSEKSTYTDQGIRANFTEKTEKRILRANDLTMVLNDKTLAGNILGRVLLIEEDEAFVYNQRTQRIEPNQNKYNSQFLYQLFNAPAIRNKIISISQGNTQIYVNWSAVRELKYMIPSLIEQQKIGKYFQNLDNQIALHKTQLDKLNNIKKGCFTKMFVAQD
jgi:type I restriction enzyme S subunit